MVTKCLIVDDDLTIAENTAEYFNMFDVPTSYVTRYDEAIEFLEKNEVSLILLDINLGEKSGFDLCKRIREDYDMPIIFISARKSDENVLIALNIGGDDYISKPFSVNEVLARVKAVLKRTGKVSLKTIVLGGLVIDTTNMNVTAQGLPVPLSRKEYDILLLLASHPGKIFSRADLIRELWKDAPYVLDRTVDVHIARIRSKLGTCRDLVTNRAGFGYSIEVNE